MASLTQHLDDGAAASGGFPDHMGQSLHPQQSLNCHGGSFIQVVAAFRERGATISGCEDYTHPCWSSSTSLSGSLMPRRLTALYILLPFTGPRWFVLRMAT